MDAKALVRDGYDRVSYAYRAESGAGHTHDYKTWVDHLCQDLEANAHVLDLGCGCGVPVAQLLAARGQVTGVDISPVQIRRAKQLLPQGRFICDDMARVDFSPATFDAVIALYAITHVPV